MLNPTSLPLSSNTKGGTIMLPRAEVSWVTGLVLDLPLSAASVAPPLWLPTTARLWSAETDFDCYCSFPAGLSDYKPFFKNKVSYDNFWHVGRDDWHWFLACRNQTRHWGIAANVRGMNVVSRRFPFDWRRRNPWNQKVMEQVEAMWTEISHEVI